MLIASSSDQHLGFQRFAGARSALRKRDFFRVFKAWVDNVIDTEAAVATLAGDLFDSADPDNESIFVAVSQLLRLSEAGIKVIAISGNHDTPKSSRTHIYSVLSELPIHCVFRETEVIEVDDVSFVAVPWSNEVLDWGGVPDGDVLIVHTACDDSPASTPNRNFSNVGDIRWDYMALGDWHKRVEISPHAHFPGALEHTSFGEENNETGAMYYGLRDGTFGYWESPSRGMVTLYVNLAGHKDPTYEINQMLMKHGDDCVRLRMTGNPGLVDMRMLEWHQLLQKEFVQEGNVMGGTGPQFAPSDLIGDWETFCAQYDIEKGVRRYGRRFLA